MSSSKKKDSEKKLIPKEKIKAVLESNPKKINNIVHSCVPACNPQNYGPTINFVIDPPSSGICAIKEIYIVLRRRK